MNSELLKQRCDAMCISMFEPPLNQREFNFRDKLIDDLVALKSRGSIIVDLVRTVFSTQLLWAPPPPVDEFCQVDNNNDVSTIII